MRLNGPVLGDVCRGRNNNLNLIRMIAATAVLVSHAWPISSGVGTTEPLSALLDVKLGTLSVYVFFAISGFLIARSFERQPTVRRWLAARALRLFPGLAVVLSLTVLVLGPLVTILSPAEYFVRPETLSYVPRNLSLAFLQYDLPGVFEDQPYPDAINGSLWTLVHEVVCYGGVLVLGLLGALRRTGLALLGFAGFAAAYALVTGVLGPDRVHPKLPVLFELALPFVMGTALYVWRARVRLHPVLLLGLVLAAALLRETPLWMPVLTAALTYGVFLLGFAPGGPFLLYNRLGDYSYGVYIYAFPTQQLMTHLFQPMSPVENIALALPATLAMAVLSWVWVEKPALSLVRGTGGRVAA
jgi:peptidoglycan/LPS O-acetylase OafA/YrhL